MTISGQDRLNTRRSLTVGTDTFDYFSLKAAAEKLGDISRLPFSLKILLENLLRFEDGRSVTIDDIKALVSWQKQRRIAHEIAYRPARVLMQDFTGVPAVVDLAAMREAVVKMGGDAQRINPLSPVDLVIDHSVMVDHFGNPKAFKANEDLEYARNAERYEFLRWGQGAFDNFRVVPPGTGICHQVNIEYLAQTIWMSEDKNNAGKFILYPDTCVGTDSHTTMVNGMGVLGWGVGGIEAEAAMLGQPISMLIPEVVGFKLTGKMKEGMTATDLVLRVVEMLRQKGVVGKFVEFFGDGLDNLSLADRATLANMAPEYGATCGIFPIDEETLRYLAFTGRSDAQVARVRAYAQEQGLWRDSTMPDPLFTDEIALDLDEIEPALAGPKRPQDRVTLSQAATAFSEVLAESHTKNHIAKVQGEDYQLEDGAVVIAAITSCTNTSNPSVLIGAGLLAKKAHEKGLAVKPWVKTSLAPGSQVVTDYLVKAGLQSHLDALGFNLVGYGCTTCIGNSGPLPAPIATAIDKDDLFVVSVLSGNRNFEGRVSPQTRANYLASPPLVVAYALSGSMKKDITTESLGKDKEGNDVFLRDIWPSNAEIRQVMDQVLTPQMFQSRYANIGAGQARWQELAVSETETYAWRTSSTYVQHPPYFQNMTPEPEPVKDVLGAKALAILGDSVTTDHISPAGSFKADTPAGHYLTQRQVRAEDFNSYGSRRGNHEIMMRGTFANIRIRNKIAPQTEGGFSKYNGEVTTMYEAAMRYQADGTPMVIFGGKEYGTGSSRDWAAKGTALLGVKAVIVESFERIHRSNLVGMGVLPLQFKTGDTHESLALDGSETFDVTGVSDTLSPRSDVTLTITYSNGQQKSLPLLCRIDTLDELDYFRNGGILPYVMRNIMASEANNQTENSRHLFE